MNIFDITNNINSSKEYNWKEFKRTYSAFMINKILSMNNDTIFFANEMNKCKLPPQMQYDFLFYSIPKKKRWSKYIKTSKNEDLKNISKYFNISLNKAQLYQKFLTPDQLSLIKQLLINNIQVIY